MTNHIVSLNVGIGRTVTVEKQTRKFEGVLATFFRTGVLSANLHLACLPKIFLLSFFIFSPVSPVEFHGSILWKGHYTPPNFFYNRGAFVLFAKLKILLHEKSATANTNALLQSHSHCIVRKYILFAISENISSYLHLNEIYVSMSYANFW